MDVRPSDLHRPGSNPGAAPSMDWGRQIDLFRRRLPLFAWVTATLFLLAASVILLIPQRYAATAEIMIDPRRERVVELQQVLPDLPADTLVVDTEVEVLKSRALAQRVVGRLKLDRDPEFNAALRPGLLTGFGRGQPRPRRPAARAPAGEEAATSAVASRLKIARQGFTYVIAVSFSSVSPAKAAAIVTAFTDAYLQQQLDAKSLAARHASDWLSARLGGLRTQVEAAEQTVERYKAEHGLMTLTESRGSTTTEQEISGLDTQLAAARAARAEADARLAAGQARIAGGGQGDDLGEVLNSPVVQELRRQRDQTAKELAGLQARYGARHPDRVKAELQKAEIDRQIQQEIARLISNLKVQAEVARTQEAAIEAALAHAKADLAQNNGASVELKELERNLESVRLIYQSFLDRSKQTSAQDGMAQSDARVVSPAKVPLAPSFPNRPLALTLALAAAVVAGLLSIWIAEVLEDGVYSADDVTRRLGLDCLGLIPIAPGDRRGAPKTSCEALIRDQPFSGFAEAFRVLKTALPPGAGTATRVIAIASAFPGEGKTTTGLCLGRTLARAGVSVAIVDCDLRRRTINRLLAEPPRAGLLDVLSGAAALEDVLIEDAGLSILPLGEAEPELDDLFGTPAMDGVLDALRARFRMTLLDTAPILLVAETRTLAAKADGVLVVARWRRTPGRAAADAVRVLQGVGAVVLGAALTQIDTRRVGARGYGYASGYYPFYRGEAETRGRAFLTQRQSRKVTGKA